ncbi:uncharacterized protein LOC118421530 isoform X1 [Branchiostoma floridae]|uniref:Uncharacterized protein LOC118421530 isoform X1 n=1 Tax=Branchiostoma floridae TaxID=7739 RepID=A0A9J7LKT5_BRAFL|nr:uncharacterized protein LOC118421530 isoform X1 [Branchiostoma floridae]XP_035684747.1 uncharacterized protein LOC118421530 isoform X1 [Branchiostoma floridae]
MAPNLRKRKRTPASSASTSTSENKHSEPEEDVVTMSTVRELLDDQKKDFTSLMDLQAKNFKSFIQTVMETTNRRLDDIIRDVEDVKGSLQNSQREIVDLKASSDQHHGRISDIEWEFCQLRRDMKLPPPVYIKREPASPSRQTAVKEEEDSDTDDWRDIWTIYVQELFSVYRHVRGIIRLHKKATVDELIRKVSEGRNMPIPEMRLMFKGRSLEYGQAKHLFDFNIRDLDTIYLLKRQVSNNSTKPSPTSTNQQDQEDTEDSDVDLDSDIWQLHVKEGSQIHHVHIHKNATVDELIRKVSKERNIPIGELEIFPCRGAHTLKYGQGKHLYDYDIQDGDEFYLFRHRSEDNVFNEKPHALSTCDEDESFIASDQDEGRVVSVIRCTYADIWGYDPNAGSDREQGAPCSDIPDIKLKIDADASSDDD